MRFLIFLLPLLLTSCKTVETAFEVPPTRLSRTLTITKSHAKPETYVLVDYSAKTAKFYQDGELKRSTGNVRLGNKISSVPRSYGTPVGEFTISKEPQHRFGKTTWRLSGPQGRRGILMHRKIGSKRYSRGCICPPSGFLNYVFRHTGNSTKLIIQR